MVFFLGLLGCAAEILRSATEFTPAPPGTSHVILLAEDTDVTPSSGYSRTLKTGSRWKLIGQTPQGAVYEVQDDVFMLEGKHMHQAHLVVTAGNRLVGFFLPVERAFVALSPAQSLKLAK
ncbi:MAG: hypothetical protein OEY27_06390 [Gammaproteobacteria bacterium]|nr:hypothetical protein [Gammaproteobacteria bacterium]